MPVGEALSSKSEAADDLISNNVPDLLANEQTWPTEEELNEAPAAQAAGIEAARPRVKRVPKGTSAYQAAWIVDEDDEGDEQDGESSHSDDDLDGDFERGARNISESITRP